MAAPDTQIDAFESIQGVAATLRAQAYVAIKHSAWGLTADEVADTLRESPLAIRPRVTELKKAGLIEDSGVRRTNRSGRNAAVFFTSQSSYSDK